MTEVVDLFDPSPAILPAGTIVSTGTVSKPFTLSGQAEVSASFVAETLEFRAELHQGNAA